MLELMITEGKKQKRQSRIALPWFQKMEDYYPTFSLPKIKIILSAVFATPRAQAFPILCLSQ